MGQPGKVNVPTLVFVCCAAARGSLHRSACVPRTVAAALQSTATTLSGFGCCVLPHLYTEILSPDSLLLPLPSEGRGVKPPLAVVGIFTGEMTVKYVYAAPSYRHNEHGLSNPGHWHRIRQSLFVRFSRLDGG